MKRLLYTGLIAIIALLIWKTKSHPKQENFPVIAITQIIDHPALDQEREGIILALKEAGYVDGQNLKILYQNAQGSIATSTQIAQRIVSAQPKVVVAISTPSAQSILAVIGGKKIPMVFTAVTDPVAAKIMKNLDEPEEWVTGVSDYLPPEPQLELVRKLVPNLKTLGVIYNPGETNSATLVQQLKNHASENHIDLRTATATRTSEVSTATQSLVGKVDAIYIPNDNTVVAAIDSVVQVGIQHRIPVFSGDEGSVRRGAAATAGYSRLKLGKLAGQMVVRILSKESPRQIPVQYRHSIEIITNRTSAKKMGLELPPNLNSKVESRMK